MMQLAATLYVEQGDERRHADRRPIGQPSTVRDGPGTPSDVEIHDLSVTGCSFASDRVLAIGAPIRIGVAGVGAFDARVVRTSGPDHAACFLTPLSPAMLVKAFATDSVVSFPGAGFAPVEAEPERWPRPVRAAMVVGGSAALWAAILVPLAAWMA